MQRRSGRVLCVEVASAAFFLSVACEMRAPATHTASHDPPEEAASSAQLGDRSENLRRSEPFPIDRLIRGQLYLVREEASIPFDAQRFLTGSKEFRSTDLVRRLGYWHFVCLLVHERAGQQTIINIKCCSHAHLH